MSQVSGALALAEEDERYESAFVNYIEFDGKACTHEVAHPPGKPGPCHPPPQHQCQPAREYAFKIDPFQQTAINVLEAGDSVLVAAHTSAGKTVVAEYAFAMALRDKQRVIYTSPLKALSNQKYRELQEEFGDVGLMTGDVTINTSASCLVMTTEILRSMLYRGSEVIREVQLLVYDEIHYLRDKERGVVWEESIILAPRSARFVFLSATIPNAREFAEWIAKIHESPCHVVYTEYRPTPLEHYVFPAGGDGVFLAIDAKGTFREDNFAKALAAISEATPEERLPKDKNKKAKKDATQTDIFKLVTMIIERNYDPVIVFSFSKKECEALANQLQALALNSDTEMSMVDNIFKSAVEVLSDEDRRLPQIRDILPMLRRGFGVHHSGLLPLLKELVEILFQEGLIKVLFATETFSTGLNMPAKTVVFTHVRKFDGGVFRWVSGGEYIQMSGRAGRRGKDDKGIVIMMMDARMEPAAARDMLKGAPDVLYSEFHLNYTMLLNLLQVEGIEPEELMRRSYRQFQTERRLPGMKKKLEELQAECDAFVIENEPSIREYAVYLERHTQVQAELTTLVMQPKYIVPFLQPGRLVQLAASVIAPTAQNAPVWATVINFQKITHDNSDGNKKRPRSTYLVDCLVNTASSQDPKKRNLVVPASVSGTPKIMPFSLAEVAGMSSIRVKVAKDLRSSEALLSACKILVEVAKRFDGAIPVLDPLQDIKIEGDDGGKITVLQRRLETAERQMERHCLAEHPQKQIFLDQLRKKQAMAEKLRSAKAELQELGSLVHLEELLSRRRVLRSLDFINERGLVSMKGTCAAAIATGDSLLLSELIYNGFFQKLSASELCTILSCFVWQGKSEGQGKCPDSLSHSYKEMLGTARRIGETARDYGMPISPEEYCDTFSSGLMEVVQAWAQGAKFADLLKLGKGLFEGSIVRVIRRLEELILQLAAALKAVGDEESASRFEAAAASIHRDVVFAASLYL